MREEPGFILDEKTPDRISAGLCQLLISTARSIMNEPKIDSRLADEPSQFPSAPARPTSKAITTGRVRIGTRSSWLAPITPAVSMRTPAKPTVGNFDSFRSGLRSHADLFAGLLSWAMNATSTGAEAYSDYAQVRNVNVIERRIRIVIWLLASPRSEISPGELLPTPVSPS